jgi:hypothetical protein
MARSFGSVDLVQLPKLGALSAQLLGKTMIVAAQGKALPATAAEALADLASAHEALQRAVIRRLPKPSETDRARAADVALDAAWSALYGTLKGWSRAAGRPEGAIAAALLPQLFPDGVRFVLLPFKLEWVQSVGRLGLIEKMGLGEELDKLSCGQLLQWIREAHKEYGEALCLTTAAARETDTTTIRDALSAFNGALREYVLRVAASVSKRDPKTSTLAEVLLAPIERWTRPGGAARVAPAPGTAPAPTLEAPASD